MPLRVYCSSISYFAGKLEEHLRCKAIPLATHRQEHPK